MFWTERALIKMKLKYMLPITAIAGAAAIVTPLAVSCGQKPEAKITYTYDAHRTSSNDAGWYVDGYATQITSPIAREAGADLAAYNDCYVKTVAAEPKYVCDGFAVGYTKLLSEMQALTSIQSMNGTFSVEVLNSYYKSANQEQSLSTAGFNFRIVNDQKIVYSVANATTSVHVQYSLLMSGFELSLTSYSLSPSNENVASMSFVNSFVNNTLTSSPYKVYEGYSPMSEKRDSAMTADVNKAVDSSANSDFAIDFNYTVSDAITGSLIKSSNIVWTKGTASYNTGIMTLGDITCADVLLTMAYNMENVSSIDRTV